MEIDAIQLYRIHDSRTSPTVQARINDVAGSAPAGASTGSHEACSFVPDGLEEITERLQRRFEGKDHDQESFDRELTEIDGTRTFEKLGSVGIACSLAFSNASGYDFSTIFPYPLGNVVGGGEHGGNTAIQEFLVLPVEASSFPEAVATNAAIYQEMKERYDTKIMGMNDEGALITRMDDNETLEALHTVAEGHGARVGLDVAGNELWNGEKYIYDSLGMKITPKEQLTFMKRLVDEYDLAYVEDPFHEEDFANPQLLRRETDCLVVGDDLFVTDRGRLERGVESGSCNAVLIKPNQAGTVTATRKTVEKAQRDDYTPVISHRSGETCDTSIADLALAWELSLIKAGIADIRIAKLNRLMTAWQRMKDGGHDPRMAECPV
jgi:enolase